jgi:GNAT superfamily N-acetyltransferase
MSATTTTTGTYGFHPLAPGRWPDLEALFGPRGAVGGCWCMTMRIPRSQYARDKGEGNRRAFRAIVESGPPPGVLAYAGGDPVGWCAVGPRRDFSVLGRSRVLAPVDDAPVWSVTCFFIRKDHRRRGLSILLLREAVAFAAHHGAAIVEGYPVEPRKPEVPPVFAHTGLAAAFRAAGFVEVARRSETRPIMRLTIQPDEKGATP